MIPLVACLQSGRAGGQLLQPWLLIKIRVIRYYGLINFEVNFSSENKIAVLIKARCE